MDTAIIIVAIIIVLGLFVFFKSREDVEDDISVQDEMVEMIETND